MGKKKYFLDIAHMHPVCPLSLSYARIFALADIWARWKRNQGFSVRFPICMHYSGSTVFKLSNAVSNFLKKRKLNETDRKILDLIFNFYKIPKEHLVHFINPSKILDYFSNVILRDLKNLQISCDYNDYFHTNNFLYQEFVRAVFAIYTEKQFITTTHKGKKSLDYSNPLFKNLTLKRLERRNFRPFLNKFLN